MQQITLRLPEDTLESLEGEADERGVSRSEYIRDVITSRHEADALRREHTEEVNRMQSEHAQEVKRLEGELETLEARVNELQAQLRAANRRNEDHAELVEYVQEQRDLERYRARREQMLDQAGILSRWKWKLTGVPVEDGDD